MLLGDLFDGLKTGSQATGKVLLALPTEQCKAQKSNKVSDGEADVVIAATYSSDNGFPARCALSDHKIRL